MPEEQKIYKNIVQDLEAAGQASANPADANEPDPLYKSYGVRAGDKKEIFRRWRPQIRQLEPERQIALARRLIESEFGEQQSIGLFILEPLADRFTSDRLPEIDGYMRRLHGWSKVDAFTGSLLRDILLRDPEPFLALVRGWNGEQSMWLRRASVVLFTRKVVRDRTYHDFALEMCENLLFAPEDLVRKGVGWALKDMLRADRGRILEYVRGLRRRGVSSVITLYAIKDLKGPERADFLAG